MNDNVSLEKTVQKLRAVVDELISDIEATGGIVFDIEDTPCPLGAPEWSDLGTTYLHACRAIERHPLISDRNEDEDYADADDDADDDDDAVTLVPTE